MLTVCWHAWRTALMTQGLRWVLDIDIVKYFDSGGGRDQTLRRTGAIEFLDLNIWTAINVNFVTRSPFTHC